MMNEDDLLKYAEKYNCCSFIIDLLRTNKGGFNPYHNNFHALCVFYNAMKIIESYGEGYFDDIEISKIGVACLYHDYNHDGGNKKLTDTENVNIALKGIEYIFNPDISSNIFDDLQKIIKATEFPYEYEVFDLSSKIIRDADLMMIFGDNIICQMINGIWQENLNKGKLYSFYDIINWTIDFYSNVTYYTEYANKMKEEKLPQVINKLQKLKSML